MVDRGRPRLGDKALTCHADVRMSKAQHAAYHAAGGADWLRAKLEEEIARQAKTPTAHLPFPSESARRAGRPCRFGRALTERREVRLTPEQNAILDNLGGQDVLRGVLQLALARQAAERCGILHHLATP